MGNDRYVVGFGFDKDLGYWTDAKNAIEIGGQNTYIDSAGRSVLVIYTQLNVPGCHWHLISKISEDEVTEPIFFLYQAIFAAAAIVFFIISFIAVNFSRSVTDPFIHSMKFAQDIVKGTLNTSLVLDRGDEISDLGLALNNMAESCVSWIGLIQVKRALIINCAVICNSAIFQICYLFFQQTYERNLAP
jgi:methyl-accepting chemotaxis protein